MLPRDVSRTADDVLGRHGFYLATQNVAKNSRYYRRLGVPLKLRVSDHRWDDYLHVSVAAEVVVPPGVGHHRLAGLLEEGVLEFERECDRRGINPRRRTSHDRVEV